MATTKKSTVKKNTVKKDTTAITLTPTTDLQQALQEHFGFEKFKGPQEAIIQSVLDGRDTFVIMPTGGGKSLCYQAPAVLRGIRPVIGVVLAGGFGGK